jgi:hypothetical protein
MRTWLLAGGALCVGLVAGFFIGRQLRPPAQPAGEAKVEAPTSPPSEERNYPSKEEVRDYLVGKTITLAGRKSAPGTAEKTAPLKRDQIEGVEVAQTSSSIDDGPWSTPVTFLIQCDRGRYAVKGQVSYRWVENKCAFFGFEVEEVGKQ